MIKQRDCPLMLRLIFRFLFCDHWSLALFEVTVARGNFEVLWGWSLELVVIRKLQQFLHISLILFNIAFFGSNLTQRVCFPLQSKARGSVSGGQLLIVIDVFLVLIVCTYFEGDCALKYPVYKYTVTALAILELNTCSLLYSRC